MVMILKVDLSCYWCLNVNMAYLIFLKKIRIKPGTPDQGTSEREKPFAYFPKKYHAFISYTYKSSPFYPIHIFLEV
jgi:hypothetical protein